jgi:predicted Zn-dependent protease
MPFSRLDCPAVARALSQLADRPDDLVDAFFERREEVELPADQGPPGVRLRREEGFAVRLVRGADTWLAARDGFSPRSFSEALRQVARVLPSAAYPEPRLEVGPWGPAPGADELAVMAELPSRVDRAVRARHVAFPVRLTVRRHRRWLRLVTGSLVPEPESESFYSVAAEIPWGRWGTLFTALDDDAAERIAGALVERFRARQASPPARLRGVVVLGPHAAAVLLHEAVAHALEVDLLALGGNPEAAVGVEMGSPALSVLDDPAAAPEGVRRTTDDEGSEVRRRWLLRDGVVQQPLADARWARRSEVLVPGAGRRGDRHAPPGPRSSHLELVPGEHDDEALAADAEGGLWVTEASRGTLDPHTGRFRLELPMARRIRGGGAAEPVGPCRLEGRVAGLLTAVAAVGARTETAGAGWCAKGGQRLPVWATAPAIRLEGVEVTG